MTVDQPGLPRRFASFFLRRLVWPLVVIFAIICTLILAHAFASRGMLPLEIWHREVIAAEFTKADYTAEMDLDDYLAVEKAVFDQLPTYLLDPANLAGHSGFCRYVRGGPQNPAGQDINWNRTVEIPAKEPKGGVLLLHGLSDSPYSMRSLAELFAAEGFHVLAQRMPGHGTVPAGLLTATWEDWAAAVKVGARHVESRIGPDRPFYLVGYSNGGALSVNHCLDAINDGEFRIPDRIILLSPAIGITPFAVLAGLDGMFGFIPYFEQSNWLDLQPEFDPYKYNSFSKNAGAQSYRLAKAVHEKLEDLKAAGGTGKLPPMLAFQSAVDDTVVAGKLISGLFDYLPKNGSELVFFDVNHAADLDGFLTSSYRNQLAALLLKRKLDFTLTTVTNTNRDSRALHARSQVPGQTDVLDQPLGLSWPEDVFSLAHVAIPFPPEDPFYGNQLPDPPGSLLPIGLLAPKGERGILRIPASQLMRMRHNPFHAFMREKIREVIEK